MVDLESMTINIAGYDVLIDAEDYQRVIDGGPWHIQHNKEGILYFAHTLKKPMRTTILLHRFIMNAPYGFLVDHRSGNTLDNQKTNLRICTHAGNNKNQSKRKDNKSGYKGVCWDKSKGKWLASIKLNGKSHNLGRFDTPESAYAAYCEASKKLQREFGRIT